MTGASAGAGVGRVAVIGAGGMGRFHAETVKALPGVELAEVCDPYPVDALAALGVPVTTDPEACAAAGWDGVIIASPDETHSALTLAALGAGSRVLCEKPLSHDVAGARAVVERERSDGFRRVQVGFMREYDPAHRAVAERLGDIGPLHQLRCTHRNANEDVRPPSTVIVQSLIHDIHTVHWLAGRVVEVDARTIVRPPSASGAGSEAGLAHVLLILRLASGATATVEFSDNTYGYEVEVEATGAAGMIATAPPARPRLRVDGDLRMPIGTDWFGWFADAYRSQDRAWADSLAGATAVGPSTWDGLAAQLVADAALASIEQGRAVAVDVESRPAGW